ncbi:MAG: DUF2520 domain-containing protein [Bacteroidales bacterium]|nr:DUF2520 domain-containing protein [Bacteroidales bacterium]
MPAQKQIKFRISFMGSGNVAWHLSRAFFSGRHIIHAVYSRNEFQGKELANMLNASYANNFSFCDDATDFLILAIDDTVLPEIINKLHAENTIVLHTSGSIGLDVFQNKIKYYGVLYPFQTLTRGFETDIANVPLCIEASDKQVLTQIYNLAYSISQKVLAIDSEKRKILHLAGILSNNFINHLVARTYDYLEKNEIDKELLFPLLNETLNKLRKISPRDAQTGPARRKNLNILEKHKALLEEEPELKKLYSLISDSIIAYYS